MVRWFDGSNSRSVIMGRWSFDYTRSSQPIFFTSFPPFPSLLRIISFRPSSFLILHIISTLSLPSSHHFFPSLFLPYSSHHFHLLPPSLLASSHHFSLFFPYSSDYFYPLPFLLDRMNITFSAQSVFT